MKLLKLVWLSIKNNLRKSCFLYSFIIAGICFSLCTHFIAASFASMEADTKSEYATYNTVSIMNITEISESTFNKLKESDVANIFFIVSGDNNPMVIGWYGERPYNWFPMGEGIFDMSDVTGAYVSSDIATYTPEEEKFVSVNGKQYKVTGSTMLMLFNLINGIDDKFIGNTADSFVFIPLTDVINQDEIKGCLRVQFNNYNSNDLEYLKSLFPGYEIIQPLQDSMFWENLFYYVSMGIICLLSYINIIISYWYLLGKQRAEYATYRIIGATQTQMYRIFIMKYLLLFIAGCIWALAFLAIFRPFVGMLNIEIRYEVKTIFIVFLVDMLVTLMISFPVIHKIVENDGCTSALRRGVDM